MTEIKTNAIPHRLKNVNKEHPYVSGARDVYDDSKNKHQQQINAEVDDTLENHQQQLNEKYNKNELYNRDETYNKDQINSMISPTDQEYENYSADDQTSSIDELLPSPGNPGTIYRIGNWDGSQYNPLTFTEYAWDGSAYTPLATKNMEQSNVRMSSTIPGMLETVYSNEEPNVMLDDDTGVIKLVYEFN